MRESKRELSACKLPAQKRLQIASNANRSHTFPFPQAQRFSSRGKDRKTLPRPTLPTPSREDHLTFVLCGAKQLILQPL